MDRTDKERLITWAEGMDWDCFATPSFRYDVATETVFKAMAEWLRPFAGAYALIGCQRGIAGHIHPHVLIGGTGAHRDTLTLLRGRWQRGNCVLDRFHPRLGGVAYLVSQAEEFDVIGSPRPYHGGTP